MAKGNWNNNNNFKDDCHIFIENFGIMTTKKKYKNNTGKMLIKCY